MEANGMNKPCTKNSHLNRFLDIIQSIFCMVKDPIHHIGKKLIHHTRKHKYFVVGYIHIILLLLVFYMYTIITINTAQEVDVPVQEAEITIQNEPQIVPDIQQEQTLT